MMAPGRLIPLAVGEIPACPPLEPAHPPPRWTGMENLGYIRTQAAALFKVYQAPVGTHCLKLPLPPE